MSGYAELGALTNFSFLEGASHPHEIVDGAQALGHAAVGVADRKSFAGVVRAHVAAQKAELRFVPGVRVALLDGSEYLAWPSDRAAWGRLTRMLSEARLASPKGECRIGRDALVGAAEGSVIARLPPEILDEAFADRMRRDMAALRKALPLPLFLAVVHRHGGDDRKRLDALAGIGAPLLAAGGVRFHVPARRRLADVLEAIRLRTTVDALGLAAAPNAEAHLKPEAEMRRLFAGHEEAIDNTMRVAAACGFSLRWPQGPSAKLRGLIAHEMKLVRDLNYAPYFLTVHEIVRFARSQGILCQGRGSAANSAICYVLGITAADVDTHDLLFERFISAARDEPPDIDVDFEHERREEVIQHIYDRYGRDRAAICATLIRYRPRSAIREVGKALGLTEDITAGLARASWGPRGDRDMAEVAAERGLDAEGDPRLALAIELADEIQDFPRHLSTHVGGFVITKGALVEHAVVTQAAMDGRTTLEWDKDDIEALRILKVDVLGLGMLTCIRRAFGLIAGAGGPRLALHTVPQDDRATYAMLSRADSLGVFQVESRAQMNMLPRLRPREFYDLVIQVAIVRPGPIQGDMVHPYLRRRNGEEEVAYPSEELRGVLGKTLGVPLFQEQAMQIAIVAAGFSPSRADQLRRAMATFRNTGEIWKFRQDFCGGMVARGYDQDFAERCFRQIEGFGTYGFPESHAASFAGLVYVSAWIKRHHPAAFAAALLNSQPMGFYAPAQIVRDAKEHGVEVRPIDVVWSDWDCTLEVEDRAPTLRLGLRLVAGLKAEDGAVIMEARRAAPFRDVADLARRARLDRGAMDALARADALRSLTAGRRHALWDAAGVEAPLPLSEARDDATPDLPPETAGEETVLDYAATGLSLRRHPLALLRQRLRELGAADTRALDAARQGRWIKVPGLVLVRQRPGSAKGVVFFTVEDEWGVANLVLYPDIVARDRAAVVGARLVLAEGRVERTETKEVPIIHLVVRRLHDWTRLLDGLHTLDDANWDRVLANADEVRSPTLHDPRDPQISAAKRGQAAMPPSRDFR